MDRSPLADEKVFPTRDEIARHLGKAQAAWDAFAEAVGAAFGDAAMEWRFYTDGQAWLCKVVHKKKTVCWSSVWPGSFKVSFYFSAKADRDIDALPIPADVKAAYHAHAPIGQLKPLLFEVRNREPIEAISAVMAYKSGGGTARKRAASPRPTAPARPARTRASRAK